MRVFVILYALILAVVHAAPPGVVIAHSDPASGRFIGSPSLCVLGDGSYLASHDFFGPASHEHEKAVGAMYRSKDRGLTWTHVTDLNGFFWQGLFTHHGKVYAMGTDRHHGQLVIRRSDDGGTTWTEPTNATSGLIAPGEWHTAPVPVIEHHGRIWRAVEDASGGKAWGARYRAHMVSAPAESDLLDAANWTISNPLPRDPTWLDGDFAAWLEGNAVVAPDGNVTDLLRVDCSKLPEKAAIVRASADGKTITFDPASGFVDMPGGAKKFTVRPDPKGGGYWTIASIVASEDSPLKDRPASIRNTLALLHSDDLRSWTTCRILLQHPDVARHGFQYVDWQFDGDDLIAVCRIAWDEDHGGARNYHDANFMTFHRWTDFRKSLPSSDDPSSSYRYVNTVENEERIESITIASREPIPRWAERVVETPYVWPAPSNTSHFENPIPFVVAPVDAEEVFYRHNHQPSVTWCDNGDLLAIWYSTKDETGTELTVLGSRLRAGASSWDASSCFFKAIAHNMHGSSLFRDLSGKLYHFNGIAPKGAPGWSRLAFVSRTSTDNGVTWTPPHLCASDYSARHQVISGTIMAYDGTLIQNCDAVPGGQGGTALQLSSDGGITWSDYGNGKAAPTFQNGTTGEGTIAGIHAGVVQLANGDLMALGRGNNIDDHMPCSISKDMGRTWTYRASPFPPIGGGQRLVLKRLREGALLIVSFTSSDRTKPRAKGLEFSNNKGERFTGYGLFAAVSMDDGATWAYRRLITTGEGTFDGGGWTGTFTANADQAEPAGYLCCTQTPDGIIHLLSSRLHYRFNLAWLKECPAIGP